MKVPCLIFVNRAIKGFFLNLKNSKRPSIRDSKKIETALASVVFGISPICIKTEKKIAKSKTHR